MSNATGVDGLQLPYDVGLTPATTYVAQRLVLPALTTGAAAVWLAAWSAVLARYSGQATIPLRLRTNAQAWDVIVPVAPDGVNEVLLTSTSALLRMPPAESVEDVG
ncbi:MAG TPA: hypothetical protein PLF40_22040, partial [Kofleriaceae bacterium]|nr:hypothetical protein [Kofleriaceae bacterium]